MSQIDARADSGERDGESVFGCSSATGHRIIGAQLDPGVAEQALTARTAARPRAFTFGVLAIRHAQTLEAEAACAAGHQLLDLAAQISSRRVCIRLGEVLDALSPYESNRAVAELREEAEPVLRGCGL
ncbi:hypothetical protein [Actinomadura litoris]|uniref:hypothetical protein n=1 Tax=Actinomadura litoris TaxID=2678616 RepID=UPI0015674DC1|nr:hypothetical protein [Actinomadura litoris]